MVFDPSGKHLKDVVFKSVNNVACTTWGGKDYNTLYVVSGKDKSAKLGDDTEGGHVFCFKPNGVQGTPKYEFAG
jgi:sugar lactone lactonase YvrE